jgi:hypothetical protein
LEVGFLEMQTREFRGLEGGSSVEAENFAVGRVKANLSGGSSVGAMFVSRQQTGTGETAADYNRAYGLDGTLNLFQNLVLSAYVAGTDERSPVGDQTNATMLQAAWRSDIVNVSGLYKNVGDGFNPGVGFVDRRGVHRYFGTAGVHPKLRRRSVLEINPVVDVDFFTTLEGSLESRSITPRLNVRFMNGGSVSFNYADRYERLFEATSIAGAAVPEGTYEWREPSIRYSAPASEVLSGSVSLSGGDFYDGRRTSVSGRMKFRPNEHFSLDLAAQHNDLDLAGRDFTANLFSAQLRYASNTRTFFMGFVQYNEATEELITNVRFNLIHAPLSDFFLVFTERRSLADGVTEAVLERGITLKGTKLLAF